MQHRYFRMFFLLSFFHSLNKQHIAEENMIITGPKKNKIKEESKKKSKKPKNVKKNSSMLQLDAAAHCF